MGAKPEPARDTKAYASEMFDYIVILKEQPGSNRSRNEVYEAGIARSAAFRHKLKELLELQGLQKELGALGEPLGLPAVTLTGTPKLADFIASLPEVKMVTRDSRELEFVR